MSRKLSKELGLGVGLSSGAYAIGAILLNEIAQNTITVFSDDNKKYLSTELTDKNITYDNPNYISNQVKFISVKKLN